MGIWALHPCFASFLESTQVCLAIMILPLACCSSWEHNLFYSGYILISLMSLKYSLVSLEVLETLWCYVHAVRWICLLPVTLFQDSLVLTGFKGWCFLTMYQNLGLSCSWGWSFQVRTAKFQVAQGQYTSGLPQAQCLSQNPNTGLLNFD